MAQQSHIKYKQNNQWRTQSVGTNISGISITALKTLSQTPSQPHLHTRKSQQLLELPILLELPHALHIQIYDPTFLLYATLF